MSELIDDFLGFVDYQLGKLGERTRPPVLDFGTDKDDIVFAQRGWTQPDQKFNYKKGELKEHAEAINSLPISETNRLNAIRVRPYQLVSEEPNVNALYSRTYGEFSPKLNEAYVYQPSKRVPARETVAHEAAHRRYWNPLQDPTLLLKRRMVRGERDEHDEAVAKYVGKNWPDTTGFTEAEKEMYFHNLYRKAFKEAK